MKKLIASASLVALGAASVNAAYAPGLTKVQSSKPWSVSASLRGFYDDNYLTTPDHTPGRKPESTFGIQVKPTVSLSLPMDTTYVGLSYSYGAKWYDNSDTWDQSHQVNASLQHRFTQDVKLDLSDNFAVFQQPQINGLVSSAFRAKGDNVRNRGQISLDAKLTRLFGVRVAYSNTLYDYQQNAGDVALGEGPSYSALLDRMEHLGSIDLRWQALPQTVGVLGYQYGQVDYTSKERLGNYFYNNNLVVGRLADFRNNRSHYIYAGIDQSFNPELNGSVRVGAQLTEYEKANVGYNASPYADASLTYTYAPGSNLRVGVRHARNATDGAFGKALDQESTAVYANLAHKIASRLTGNLFGQYQNSEFKSSAYPDINGKNENLYLVGVSLDYAVNQFFGIEAGYDYDKLDSDLSNRSFSRNRVFAGVHASF